MAESHINDVIQSDHGITNSTPAQNVESHPQDAPQDGRNRGLSLDTENGVENEINQEGKYSQEGQVLCKRKISTLEDEVEENAGGCANSEGNKTVPENSQEEQLLPVRKRRRVLGSGAKGKSYSPCNQSSSKRREDPSMDGSSCITEKRAGYIVQERVLGMKDVQREKSKKETKECENTESVARGRVLQDVFDENCDKQNKEREENKEDGACIEGSPNITVRRREASTNENQFEKQLVVCDSFKDEGEEDRLSVQDATTLTQRCVKENAPGNAYTADFSHYEKSKEEKVDKKSRVDCKEGTDVNRNQDTARHNAQESVKTHGNVEGEESKEVALHVTGSTAIPEGRTKNAASPGSPELDCIRSDELNDGNRVYTSEDDCRSITLKKIQNEGSAGILKDNHRREEEFRNEIQDNDSSSDGDESITERKALEKAAEGLLIMKHLQHHSSSEAEESKKSGASSSSNVTGRESSSGCHFKRIRC